MSTAKATLTETRTALLNGFVRKSEIFKTSEGIEIEIREPTVGQRGRMLQAGKMNGAGEVADFAAMQVSAVIECCFLPGSNKALFSAEDVAVIEGLPTASWFDDVSGLAMKLMTDEAEEAGKPLVETPSALTSSSSLPSSAVQLAS